MQKGSRMWVRGTLGGSDIFPSGWASLLRTLALTFDIGLSHEHHGIVWVLWGQSSVVPRPCAPSGSELASPSLFPLELCTCPLLSQSQGLGGVEDSSALFLEGFLPAPLMSQTQLFLHLECQLLDAFV